MSGKRHKGEQQATQMSLFVLSQNTPQWQALSTELRETTLRLVTQMYRLYLNESRDEALEQGEARDQ